MHADIYNSELWNNFFLMVGGGVAAIAIVLNVAFMISAAWLLVVGV